MSSIGVVQLFVAAYARSGEMLFEEYYKSRPGETMTQALDWGIARAVTITSCKLVPLSSSSRLSMYRVVDPST
jgi:hypothetical protein